MTDIRFHDMPDGRRIALRKADGAGPCLVFLPGYMSDMAGGKASALFEQARDEGRAALLLDYSGCGESSGSFADGTLSRWRDEVLALVESHVNAPIILVGSSMGGWLMLLVGEALGARDNGRLAGMVGIAAAPDFTRWGYSDEQRAQLAHGQIVYEDNPYGPEPTPTHPGFFADAESHMRLGQEIAIRCPVRLLHGQCDADVPWEVSLKLAEALRSDDVQVTLIKDGDHRLSRDADIALLKRTVSTLT
ncbi:Alpha/beta hydrolase family protein [Erythrobacter litoralis]|jgi:pimeloyl-ACP methyl ester carboxylesterase|uniref:Palmitoyl-protein thioesterase ABHD10, mitochondrial n=1 Tax=Erythrobacter litoralis TaxID=39960 RepID=A0A074MNA4_9SPHN|nr:alpha/beta hydrolase [Erythrobacter litoralis]AOL24948.1 Alpha/beta hydrolase family protein [Erythrobacter litoralis]KEO96471.1 alpha/beta hydrolase [Erythrobacter litoralis]MEE4337898.1 alpha/beta hydrolase [Erythrobacter sp.]